MIDVIIEKIKMTSTCEFDHQWMDTQAFEDALSRSVSDLAEEKLLSIEAVGKVATLLLPLIAGSHLLVYVQSDILMQVDIGELFCLSILL